MHHCSTKWAIFLMSVKSLVETGKGAPFPNDTPNRQLGLKRHHPFISGERI